MPRLRGLSRRRSKCSFYVRLVSCILDGTDFGCSTSFGRSTTLGLLGPRALRSFFSFGSSVVTPSKSAICCICWLSSSRFVYSACSFASASMLFSYDERWVAYAVVRIVEQCGERLRCLGGRR